MMIRRSVPFALALFAGVRVFIACQQPPQTAAQAAAEGAYGAALLKCVDDSNTLAESKACRARVDAQFGVVQTFHDAGGDQ
mgnify:CR=1 FL=1